MIEEMMDSEDFTPPSSPSMSAADQLQQHQQQFENGTNQFPDRLHFQDGSEDSVPLCFNCLGDIMPGSHSDLTDCTLLRRGYINKLLTGSTKPLPLELDLFNFRFNGDIERHLDKIFNLIKQKLIQLEQCEAVYSSLGSNEGIAVWATRIRQSIRECFDFLSNFVTKSVVSDHHLKIVQEILSHVRSLLLHVGILSDLPSHSFTFRNGNKSSSGLYHSIHAGLEVRLACIELLHHINVSFPDGVVYMRPLCTFTSVWDGCSSDDLSKLVHFLLWDLLVLFIDKHNKLSSGDYDKVSMFPCSCFREFFIILIQLLQYRQQRHAKQSFWLVVTPILSYILRGETAQQQDQDVELNCDIYTLPLERTTSSDPIGFCWWFLWNVVPLYGFNENGDFTTQSSSAANCYHFVQILVQKSLSLPESQLRCWMRLVVRLAGFWDSNSNLIMQLWEHFSRKLNDRFAASTSCLSSIACISKSPADLLNLCETLKENDKSFENETSFLLFLRFLSMFLRQSGVRGAANQEWRQVKGRFISKFSSRKLQELNEVGLHNVTCLFLVIASSADLDDVGVKLLELYGMLDISKKDFIRQTAVWKGTLALLLLSVQNKQDISYLAERMVALFNKAALEFSEQSRSSDRNNVEQWKLVQLYLDGVQDVVDSSQDLSLNEHKLIGEGFQDLLKTCNDNELQILITFFQELFSKHRSVCKRLLQTSGISASIKGFADALWKNVFAFVKQHSTTLTPPSRLADLAASFTLLSLNFSPSFSCDVKDDFLQCFLYFGLADQVNVSLSCRYLSHMLPNRSVMERLALESPKHERMLVQAWFRMAWYVDDQLAENYRQLTRSPHYKFLYTIRIIEVVLKYLPLP